MRGSYGAGFLFCLLFYGSAGSAYPDFSTQQQQPKLVGTITEGRYIACDNCFSVAVPNYRTPRYAEDEYMENKLAAVAFYNDEGYFMKVEVDEISREATSIMKQHPNIKEEVLDAIVKDVVLPQMMQEVANAKILYEKSVSLEKDEPAYFMVLDFPKGATIVDKVTGQSFDSKRGYLFIFSQDKYLITLCMQDPYSLQPRFAESSKIHLNERLLTHLKEIYTSFRQ